MKKQLIGILTLLLTASAAGCSVADKINEKTSEKEGSETSVVEPETVPEETTAPASSGDVILPDEEGYAEGYIGDTLRNAFFDYTVNSATLAEEYKGIKPAEGKKLLVVNITMTNTTKSSLPMFDTDFFLYQSDDEENPYIDPITAANPELKADGMLESEYSIGIRETVIVYEVPENQKDFTLVFEEYFDNEEYGDIFTVRFTAK